MKKSNIIVVVVILIIVIGLLIFLGRSKKPVKPLREVLPTEVIIPTVDKSVEVDLLSRIAGKEVTLTISNIPAGTQTIEYSLSYNTKKQTMQGVIGTVTVTDNETDYKKDITLGTCSSGRCVFHEVSGPIKLSLKFIGDYGERIFEKEFSF